MSEGGASDQKEEGEQVFHGSRVNAETGLTFRRSRGPSRQAQLSRLLMDSGDMGRACSSYCHPATIMKRLALFLLAALTLHAQQRVEVSRDLWISAYSKEVEGNNGGSHRLKQKGILE